MAQLSWHIELTIPDSTPSSLKLQSQSAVESFCSLPSLLIFRTLFLGSSKKVLSPLCICSPRWPSIICWGDNTTGFTLTLRIIVFGTDFAKWLRLNWCLQHTGSLHLSSVSLSILLFKCHCYWTKSGLICLERQLMLYFGKFLSKCLW